MKNAIGFLVLAACISPFGRVVAKDTPTPFQKSRLSLPIDGLTLLTGPDLLSPPIGAVKVRSSEEFYFRYSTTGRIVDLVPTDHLRAFGDRALGRHDCPLQGSADTQTANKAPEPTPGAVTPRAIEGEAK